MLNYFLKFLIGSEKRDLKVKSPEEFAFRPASLVQGISGTYVHLGNERRATLVLAPSSPPSLATRAPAKQAC